MIENEKLVRDETEAIECLKSNKPTSGYLMLQESIDMAIKALEEVQQYRAIGTLEKCRAVMEKQTAKKPIVHQCPACGNAVMLSDGKCCSNCGQKLDWSDVE